MLKIAFALVSFFQLSVSIDAQSINYFQLAQANDSLDIFLYSKVYQPYQAIQSIDSVYNLLQAELSNHNLKQLNEVAYGDAIDRLGHHNIALDILTKVGAEIDQLPIEIQSDYYCVMGNVALRSMNPSFAVQQYQRSLDLVKNSTTIRKEIIQAKWMALGKGFNALLKHEEAQKQFDKALEFEVDGPNRNSLYLRLNIALTDSYLGRLKQAKAYLKEALQIITYNKDDFAAIRTYGNLADIYLKQDSIQQAYAYYCKGLQKASSEGFVLDVFRFEQSLSNLFKKTGQLDSAFVHVQIADSIRQTYHTASSSERVVKMDLYHKIKHERLEKELQKTLYRQAQQQKNFFIAFCFLLLIACLMLVWQLRQLQEKNKVLLKQQLATIKSPPTVVAASTPTQNAIYTELIQGLEDLVTRGEVFTDNSLSLESLAKQLQTNRTYLSEAINAYYSKNFSQWLNELRIDAAKALLASSDYDAYSIEGLAKKVGFSSTSAFNSNFKKLTGLTPSYFRKNRSL